jgi:hypothetical protein
MSNAQNCAVFKTSSFNTSVQREYFINPSCFGDDAARWIIVELGIRGFHADKAPRQQDFGWYFAFDAGGVKHNAVIGYRPGSYGEVGEWICWIERRVGPVGVMLGRRKNVKPEAVKAIQDVLSSSPAVKVVKFCDEGDL